MRAAPSFSTEPEAMNGLPWRTLLVEYEPSTRHFIQAVLRARGHQVEACADAETAWDLAQQDHFSLAVLDMRLPGMDGAALCSKLKKLHRGDETVVMFVTGADSLDDLGRALEAGADDYVLKPVVEANLPVRFALAERRVHFALDRKKTERGLTQDALRDSVTDLVNRTLFSERLQRTARRCGRENQKPGRGVINEAARQLAEWLPGVPDGQDFFLPVNVSGRQFVDPELVVAITDAQAEHHLPPGALHVEITETALMTDLDDASRILMHLREASVEIHVDDFGTGYSSLAYLCRLPIHGLKIARSFVRYVTDSQENLEVVRAITSLAETLGLTVIAEGVETENQLGLLRSLPCHFGQGFLFGRPGSAEAIEQLLRERVSV